MPPGTPERVIVRREDRWPEWMGSDTMSAADGHGEPGLTGAITVGRDRGDRLQVAVASDAIRAPPAHVT
jgi:hypothetical protein